jgi:hypothetical protein
VEVLARMVVLVLQERVEVLVHREVTVVLVLQERVEVLVHREVTVVLVLVVPQVHLVFQELMEHQEALVHQVHQEALVHQVHQELMEALVQVVVQVLVE